MCWKTMPQYLKPLNTIFPWGQGCSQNPRSRSGLGQVRQRPFVLFSLHLGMSEPQVGQHGNWKTKTSHKDVIKHGKLEDHPVKKMIVPDSSIYKKPDKGFPIAAFDSRRVWGPLFGGTAAGALRSHMNFLVTASNLCGQSFAPTPYSFSWVLINSVFVSRSIGQWLVPGESVLN